MSKPLQKRNDYRESPDYTPDPATELQSEYTKLIAVHHALDSISGKLPTQSDTNGHVSAVFNGAMRILESIIPRIEQIQEAIDA